MPRSLLALLTLVSALPAAAPPVERPIPKGSRHLLTANGWWVVDHRELYPETKMHRAQSFHHRLFAGKVGSGRGRLVFEGRDTHGGPRVLTVRADGTVLLDVYPSRLVFVGPGDAVAHFGQGKPVRVPGVEGDLRLLHANDFGLVAVDPKLNTTVKVYFVPLAGRDPVGAKRVELVEREANGIYHTRTGFHVSERWVVWGGREIGLPYTKPHYGPIVAFDCQTGRRWDVPVPEEAAVLGAAGDLAVFRHGKAPAGKYVGEVDAYDLVARKRLTSYPTNGDTRLLEVRDGVGHFTAPLPDEVGKKAGRSVVIGLDLRKQREPVFRRPE